MPFACRAGGAVLRRATAALALVLSLCPACYQSTVELSGEDDVPPAVDDTRRADDGGVDGPADDGGVDVPPEDFFREEYVREEYVREEYGGDLGEEDGVDGVDATDGPCTPVIHGPLEIASTAADVDERPVILRSEDGFVALARVPAPVSADGLRLQRFERDGSSSGPATWILSSVEIGPWHPLLEYPDGRFVTTFQVPEGSVPGIWLRVNAATGWPGEMPQHVPGTDAASIEPDVAFDGTNGYVLWTQSGSAGGGDEFRVQAFDPATGIARGDAATVMAGIYSEPRIAWAGSCLLAVYTHTAPDTVPLLELDDALGLAMEYRWSDTGGGTLIGEPAVAWNGSELGILVQVFVFAAAETRLMLLRARCGDGFLGSDALVEIVEWDVDDPGEVALTWAEEAGEWGLAFTYGPPRDPRVALARVDPATRTVVGGIVVLNPGGEASSHPSIAYNAGTYAVTWVEDGPTGFPVYVATYGCPP